MEGEEGRVRRGYRPVTALDPNASGVVQYLVSEEKMTVVCGRGMGAAKDIAYSLREVLIDPTAIFRGVREEGEKNWLCYVGIPKHSYANDGATRPPRQGRVFLVYVNDEGVVYHWRWDQCCAEDSRLPDNHQNRFDERVR
jgi:hypothetical protein